MKQLQRLFFICLIIGLAGCAAQQTQQERFSREVQEEQERVEQLRAIADSLTATRLRLLEDYRNLQEISNLSPEELGVASVTATRSSGGDEGFMAKIGNGFKAVWRGLKKLWPL